MKRRWIAALTAVVVIASASYSGWRYWSQSKKAPVYEPVAVTRTDITKSISSTGYARPQNRVEVKPPIAGRVDALLVQEGNAIKKGQILAWMSSTERAALLDSARIKGESELRRWEELYRPTPIIASIGGTVIARLIEPGQTVASAEAILVLSDQLIFKVQVDETDISSIRIDQAARVEIDAYPDRPFEAKVDHIAYEAQIVNNVTMYDVDVLPDKMPEFVRSGMSATITFVLDSRSGVIAIPASAVQRDNGKTWVFKKGRNGKPVRQNVKLGFSDGRQTEVIEGLSEGETVLMVSLKMGGQSSRSVNPFSPASRRSSQQRR